MRSKPVIISIILIAIGLLITAGISGYAIKDSGTSITGSESGAGTKSGMVIEEPAPNCKETIETYEYLRPVETEKCVPVTTTVNECAVREVAYVKSEKCYWIGDELVSSCAITNLDNTGGEFVVEIGVRDREDNVYYDNKTVGVSGGDSEEFEYREHLEMGKCYCAVSSVPEKEVCQDVIKTEEKCYTLTNFEVASKERTIVSCD